MARLVIIARRIFADMEKTAGPGEWWSSGVVKRSGTYLAELRRWLDTFPKTDERMLNVTELLRGEDDKP